MKFLNEVRKYFDKLTTGILAVGLIAIATVLYSQWLMSRTFGRDQALIRISHTVKQKTIVAHLWFEEAVAGDESIDIDRDIYQNIDETLKLITAELEGGNTRFGRVEPIQNVQGRSDLLALQKTIRRWRDMTELRWQKRETTGRTGEALDQAYDAIFFEILDWSQKFALAIDILIAQNRTMLMWSNGVNILFLLIIFATMAVILFRHRRAIEAKNAELETRVEERTAQLVESETQIRAIVDNAGDGIITMDKRGIVQMFNSTAARIFGYLPKEVIGKNINMLIASPDRDRHDQYLERYLQTGEKKIIGIGRETEGRRKDGKIVLIELSVNAIFVGEKQMFIGILRDITERKQLEETERKRTEQIICHQSALLQLTKMDTSDLDSALKKITAVDSETLDVERVSVWLFNQDHSEIICENLYERSKNLHEKGLMLSASQYPNYFDTLQESRTISANDACKDARTNEFTENYLKPFGITSMMDVPIRLHGKMVGVVCHEHTGPKREWTLQEQDFAASITDMVSLALEASERRQAEKKLYKAKEVAEIASRTKSEFLANMSHEIRTPMNGIIGFSDILADEELPPNQMEYVKTIQNSAASLLTIINDILDFSKIEAGKLGLEFIDFDLRTSLEEVTDLLAFKAEDKGLAFSCFLHPQVEGLVNGDPGRLKQILINLANNAVKFTKQGEVAIRGELEHETETEVCVRFSVTDTGIGIPKKAQQKLFESFSQVDASNTRKFGGTGLGLTISKQLAEMMDGEIGFESQEGKGSTFWFTVLLKKQPQENRKKQAPNIDLTGKRILVVDNNQTNRELLRLQLQSWHCVVEEAEDATAAIQLLRQQAADQAPFEMTLVDMQTPGLNGETLGKTIKSDLAIKDTNLIMLTTIGKRGDARRVSKIGFDAYLTKPLRQSQLYDCLVTLLNNNGGKVSKKQLVTRHTLAEDGKLKFKILLVEDNFVNQKVATKMLQKLGCQVDVAVNGKEAVEMVQNAPYDLLFMDCQMPVMDGFEATRTIRLNEDKDSHVTIVALTANAMKGDRERCLEAGMDDYISKPINAKKLKETLEKWIDNSENERVSRKHSITVVNEKFNSVEIEKD